MSALKKLKIVMIAVQHGAKDDRIFYKEAASLSQRGHDVVILFAGDKEDEYQERGVHIKSIAPNLSKPQILLKKVFKGKFYSQFHNAAVQENADIYVAHEPQSVLIALNAAEETESIAIFDSHESLNFSNRKDVYARKYHIPRIQHFIAVNSMVADDIREFRSDADIQIIRNSSVFSSSDMIHKDPLTVCFEGVLSFDRGLKEMCALFIEVLDKRSLAVNFKIIGQLYGSEKDYFQKLAVENPSLDEVVFTGWKDYMEVQSELESGSIGLIMNHRTPNNVYSSPNKLFNYIACNMCVLSVDLPFITDLVGQYENGIIIETLDPVLFADAIELLVKDSDLLLTYCEKSKKAHQELSWDVESQRLNSFLETVAGSRKES